MEDAALKDPNSEMYAYTLKLKGQEAVDARR
jgi:hypothetical protein